MSYVETDIPSAFLQQLATLSPALSIAFENEDFTPTPGQTWLEVFWLPAKTVAAEIGVNGGNTVTGLFQITVHTPHNVGLGAGLAVVGSLVELFTRGTFLSYGVVPQLLITSTSVVKGQAVKDWYSIPVSIYYWGLTSN